MGYWTYIARYNFQMKYVKDKNANNVIHKTYGKITSLGVCPLDDDIVFCGDSLGHVYILKLCNGSKKRLDEPNVE